MFICSSLLLPLIADAQETHQRGQNANFSVPNAAARPASRTRPIAAAPFSPIDAHKRNARKFLGAGTLVCKSYEDSVVRIIHEGERVGLGTVVSKNGHVLTKLSLVRRLPPNEIRFVLRDHSWSGSMAGFDSKDDLAIYKLHQGDSRPEEFLKAVNFANTESLPIGKIVIGVGQDSDAIQLGMVTPAPLNAAIKDDCEQCIDLGLSLKSDLTVSRVYPRTAGERLGLLVGDRIVSINQQQLKSAGALRDFEQSLRAGDLVSIDVLRGGKTQVVSGRIPKQISISKRDRWGGGPFSQRRSGFREVIVHDSVVDPLDCGGPLVNLDGDFCGINIARSMRVASMAIPTKSILDFLNRYLDEDELKR